MTSQQTAGQEDWTAQRCGRLLRQLITTISALRKLAENEGSQVRAKSAAAKRKNVDRDGAYDPQKKVRRTYSTKHRASMSSTSFAARSVNGRSQSTAGPSTAGTFMNIATPAAQRLSGAFQTPTQCLEYLSRKQCWHLRACSDSKKSTRTGHFLPVKCELDRARFRGMSAHLLPPTYHAQGRVQRVEHYNAIYKILDTLVRPTSAQPLGAAGPKSLLAMCLRKVPEVIAEQEELEQLESESKEMYADLSVLSQIYWELESFYGTSEHGWKHLSVVVRSHGIKLIGEAVMDGLIDRDWALLFARVCDQAEAFSDRCQLMEANVLHFGDSKSIYHGKPTAPLPRVLEEELLDYQTGPVLGRSAGHWTEPLTVSLLSELLNDEQIPNSWILSQSFGEMWSAAATDLTTEHPKHGTMSFIIAAIQVLATLPTPPGKSGQGKHTDAQQSYNNALSVLTTMSIMGHNTLETAELSPAVRCRIARILRRVGVILHTCLAEMRGSRAISVRRNAYLLQLALFFSKGLHTPSCPDDGELLANFWPVLKMQPSPQDQIYGSAIALAATVAHSCTRQAGDAPPRDCLGRIFDRLRQVCPKISWLKRMRIEAFCLLAEKTGQLTDYVHAEELAKGIDGRMDAMEAMYSSPPDKTSLSGFRWDRSISEWVTSTPLVVRGKRTNMLSAARRATLTGIIEDYFTDTGSEEEDNDTLPTSPLTGVSYRGKPPVASQYQSQSSAEPPVMVSPHTKGTDGPVNTPDSIPDDADELSFCVDNQDQENQPMSTVAVPKHVKQRRHSSRSSAGLKPRLKRTSGTYGAELSDDELA